MKKVMLVVSVCSVVLLSFFSLFFASEYKKDAVSGLYFDQRGLPIDFASSDVVFQGQLVTDDNDYIQESFYIGNGKTYIFSGSKEIMDFYNKNKDMVKEKYKWDRDQKFLNDRYTSIYVNQTIPAPSFNINDILGETNFKNFEKGFVHAYTFYAFVDGRIKPIITYLSTDSEKGMLESFETLKEWEEYDFDFKDMFLLY